MHVSKYDLILIAITISIIVPIAYVYYDIEKPHEVKPLYTYQTGHSQFYNATVYIFNNNRENRIAQNDNLLFVVKITNTNSRPLDMHSQLSYSPRNGNTWQSAFGPLERVEPNNILTQNFTSNPDTVDINSLTIQVGAINASSDSSMDIWKTNSNFYSLGGSEPKDLSQSSLTNVANRQKGEVLLGYALGDFQVQSPLEVAQEESTETSQKSLQLSGIIGFSTVMALMANYVISRRQFGSLDKQTRITETNHNFSTMTRIFQMLGSPDMRKIKETLANVRRQLIIDNKPIIFEGAFREDADMLEEIYNEVSLLYQLELINKDHFIRAYGGGLVTWWEILKDDIGYRQTPQGNICRHFREVATELNKKGISGEVR